MNTTSPASQAPKKASRCILCKLLGYVIPTYSDRIGVQRYMQLKGRVYLAAFLLVFANSFAIRFIKRCCSESVDSWYYGALILAMCYIMLWLMSVNSRRIHDLGRSGWWVVSPLFLAHKFMMGIDEEGEPGSNKWGRNSMEAKEQPEATPIPVSPEVRRIYFLAVRKNDKPSQLALAKRYFTGDGVMQSKTIALHWAIKAADGGYADAVQFINSLKF